MGRVWLGFALVLEMRRRLADVLRPGWLAGVLRRRLADVLAGRRAGLPAC